MLLVHNAIAFQIGYNYFTMFCRTHFSAAAHYGMLSTGFPFWIIISIDAFSWLSDFATNFILPGLFDD